MIFPCRRSSSRRSARSAFRCCARRNVRCARCGPQWGAVVLVGLGGVWTEALNDVRLMPPDLPGERIIAEIGRLKGARLLHGLRGSAPVDLAAVADVAMRIGALMRTRSEI